MNPKFGHNLLKSVIVIANGNQLGAFTCPYFVQPKVPKIDYLIYLDI